MTKALLALMGETALIGELSGATFVASSAEQDGQALGSALGSALPIFYASTRNELLAYFAKIHCNESAKIPAFCNVVPELNHNEMQGFVGGAGATARTLVQPLIAVFFRDASDDAREQRRMGLTKALLGEQGIRTVEVVLPSEHRTQTFLYGTWLARAAARALAERYSVPPDETPLIAAFKAQL
jgi:glucose/mannose-6-phosphate isomerase